MSKRPTTSVCFLASDGVYDWAIALLESLRANSPDVNRVLIPYNQQLDRLKSVQNHYGFQIMDDPRLSQLEDIGRTFGQHRFIRNFRKLAAAFGPADINVFLDSDVIVLDDLNKLGHAMLDQHCQFSYFDQSRLWVYNTWDFIHKMERDHGTGLFNSGAWAIQRDSLTIDAIRDLAAEARSIKHEMYPGYDQSVPNFCVDRGGLRPRSVADLMPGYSDSHKPLHQRELVRTEDGFFIRPKRTNDPGKQVMLLHWAGSGLHPFMPMRSTWIRYRLAAETPLSRLGFFARVWSNLPAQRIDAWRKRKTYPSVTRPTPI